MGMGRMAESIMEPGWKWEGDLFGEIMNDEL
jgi:hypothetical protein